MYGIYTACIICNVYIMHISYVMYGGHGAHCIMWYMCICYNILMVCRVRVGRIVYAVCILYVIHIHMRSDVYNIQCI